MKSDDKKIGPITLIPRFAKCNGYELSSLVLHTKETEFDWIKIGKADLFAFNPNLIQAII